MAWLDFGMSKSEIRVVILLMALSLTAVSFSVLFPASEPWILVLLGTALLATVLMLLVLWKVVRRERSKNFSGQRPPAQGKNRRVDEDERRIRDHLMMVEAQVGALDRRDEVFQMTEDSEDEGEARRRVGQLLGVGELGSRAVLDMQVRRFTRDYRQRLDSEAEELRSKLPDGR
jgi:hypothetical protein